MSKPSRWGVLILAGWLAAGPAPVRAQPPATQPGQPGQASAGPGDATTPPALWGGVAHDEINDEWVWFGGSGGPSRAGALGTWVLKDGRWRELAFDPPADCLAAGCAALAADPAAGPAAERLKALAGELAGGVAVKHVAAAREAWLALVRQAWARRNSPPPRSRPAMAFDRRTGKIVLFGGEGVHGVCNDTWLYDCRTRTWGNPAPRQAPTPRLNAGLIARDGEAYLIGGYQPHGDMGYQAALWRRIPFDVWRYDIAANTWTRLSAGQDHPFATTYVMPIEVSISADGSRLTWKSDDVTMGRVKRGEASGEFRLPGEDADTAGAATAPDTLLVRGVGFDPAWYEAAQVPPPDPAGNEARLAALPANRWVNQHPPREHVERDWGTTVLDARRDQLLHWGGGHCTHFGTDVAHYSIATNRWHILHTPELPFEYCYNSGGVPVPPLTVRPWAPHTYLGYALDPASGLLLWAGGHAGYRRTCPDGIWLYDPAAYRWRVGAVKPLGGWFDPTTVKTCMVPTARGVAVWACKLAGYGGPSGMWLADVPGGVFRPVAGAAREDTTTYPASAFGDRAGIAYDAKRDRVLLFHFGIADKHKVWATDLASGKVTILTPKNSQAFPADAWIAREATYIPDADVVVICTPGKPAQHTLVYDCAADAWLCMAEAPAVDDRARPSPLYGVNSGIEWDAKRKLLWHVAARGEVHALRFDRATAGLRPLTPASQPSNDGERKP